MSKNNSQQLALENLLSSRSLGLKITEFAILFVIDVLALIGNVLICVAVYRRAELRTTANTFIVALAVTYILMALLPMPLSLGALAVDAWPFGELVCQLQGFMIYLLVFQSLQLITLTAINRNFHVMRSTLHKRIFTPKKTWLMIILTIVFSAILMGTPTLILSTYFAFHPGKAFCSVSVPSLQNGFIFTAVFGTFFVVIPTIVITACYVRVLRAIRHHRREFEAARGKYDSGSILSREEIKVSRIVFVIILGFSFCWIPCVIIDIMDTIQTAYLPRQVYLLYTYLDYTSSMINPWIYGGMNKLVRKEMFSLFTCCQSTQPSASDGALPQVRE